MDLVFKTDVPVQTVQVQQVPFVQRTTAQSAVHVIPVTVCPVAHVFRINVPARMVPVQPVLFAQRTMAQSAVHVIPVIVW